MGRDNAGQEQKCAVQGGAGTPGQNNAILGISLERKLCKLIFKWHFLILQFNFYKAIIPTSPPRICYKTGLLGGKIDFTSNKALGREWNSSKKCASAELFS